MFIPHYGRAGGLAPRGGIIIGTARRAICSTMPLQTTTAEGKRVFRKTKLDRRWDYSKVPNYSLNRQLHRGVRIPHVGFDPMLPNYDENGTPLAVVPGRETPC
jgi:hypothetical protein